MYAEIVKSKCTNVYRLLWNAWKKWDGLTARWTHIDKVKKYVNYLGSGHMRVHCTNLSTSL